MKIRFLSTHKSAESYFQAAVDLYSKKIGHYVSFDFEVLKPKGMDRALSSQKRDIESETILKKVTDREWVILFDEKGRPFDSVGFSKNLVGHFDSGKSPITFVIGGAYGASEPLKKRANQTVQLSDMTMNHLVATVVAMEQIYRALTIWKGIPYHNE